MFKKLRLQLTLFFAAVAGFILIIMTLICLTLSEKGTKENSRMSFMNSVANISSYMGVQRVLSYQWLAQQEQSGNNLLALYDNGSPLFMDTLKHDAAEQALIETVREIAFSQLGFDPDLSTTQKLATSEYFSMTDRQGTPYYCAALAVPKSAGTLHALVIHSRAAEMERILWQRWLFAFLDLAALMALGIFCWFFTHHIIRPVEEGRKKQSQFIASASHELRAPLAVILSANSALKTADREDSPRFLESIHQETVRMSHLVDEMLTLANSDAHSWNMKRVPTQLDTLVLNVYENYEVLAKEQNISLTISLPEDSLPDCACDGERISQVLSILLDNALSYTPANGQVHLSLTYESAKFAIRVADSGPGIPDEQKALIFERFYRGEASHTSKSHFGLGLCIAKEIVILHKGRIWVEDTPNGGALFTVLLS